MANERLQQSLAEKDETLKKAQSQQRNMIQDATQKTFMNGLLTQIKQLEEQVEILSQKLGVQRTNSVHGYF